jgi:hypothetical protein
MQACLRNWQSADHMNGRFWRKAVVHRKDNFRKLPMPGPRGSPASGLIVHGIKSAPENRDCRPQSPAIRSPFSDASADLCCGSARRPSGCILVHVGQTFEPARGDWMRLIPPPYQIDLAM